MADNFWEADPVVQDQPKGSGNYETSLSPDEESQFQVWKAKFAPKDSGDDYDLRGAFKAGLVPGQEYGTDKVTPGEFHWDDSFKKPNHPTFSNLSIYAKDRPDLAGSWNGATYIPPANSDWWKNDPTVNTENVPQGTNPSYLHRLATNLFYSGKESLRQQPIESDADYQSRLLNDPEGQKGERPPGAIPVAKAIDWYTSKVSGGNVPENFTQNLVEQSTRESNPGEISLTNAGIPRPFEQQKDVLPQIGAAAGNFPVDMANFALSPGGSSLRFLEAAPALVQRAVAAGFALQQAWQSYNAGTLQEKLGAALGAGLGAVATVKTPFAEENVSSEAVGAGRTTPAMPVTFPDTVEPSPVVQGNERMARVQTPEPATLSQPEGELQEPINRQDAFDQLKKRGFDENEANQILNEKGIGDNVPISKPTEEPIGTEAAISQIKKNLAPDDKFAQYRPQEESTNPSTLESTQVPENSIAIQRLIQALRSSGSDMLSAGKEKILESDYGKGTGSGTQASYGEIPGAETSIRRSSPSQERGQPGQQVRESTGAQLERARNLASSREGAQNPSVPSSAKYKSEMARELQTLPDVPKETQSARGFGGMQEMRGETGVTKTSELAESLSHQFRPDLAPERTTGVANRVLEAEAEAGMIDPVESGEGMSHQEMVDWGRKQLNEGADPQMIARRFQRNGRISPADFAVIRAERERLAIETTKAEQIANDNPGNLVAKTAYDQARKAEGDWIKNVVQPAKTKTSDIFRGMQGEAPVDTSTFAGLRRAVLDSNGREPTPIEVQGLKLKSERVQKASRAEAEAVNKLGETLERQSPKTKTPTLDELRAEMEIIAKELTPCE